VLTNSPKIKQDILWFVVDAVGYTLGGNDVCYINANCC